MPPRGTPPLQSGGQNQKWPPSGQGGYITPAAWGIPSASERGTKSEVAHLWARWLHNPYRLGDPHRFRAGESFNVWPTCAQGGYISPAASGLPPLLKSGGRNQKVAQLWARWLHNPSRLGAPLRFRAGDKIRSGPLVGRWLHKPCRLGDAHRFRAGEKIRSGPLVGKVAT